MGDNRLSLKQTKNALIAHIVQTRTHVKRVDIGPLPSMNVSFFSGQWHAERSILASIARITSI